MAPTAEDIERQSNVLMAGFRQHRDAFIAQNPTLNDESRIFEGWCIQKLASLQLLVIDLVEQAADERERR